MHNEMMTIEDFTHFIETYGADPNRWPIASNKSITGFLLDNTSAKKVLAEYQELEQRMDSYGVPEFRGLEQKVLKQALPPQRNSLLAQLLNWIIPKEASNKQLWRPAVAACLPLMFGIVLGNYYSFGIDTVIDEYDYWEGEFAFRALSDYSEGMINE